jgi:hypothetical protein
MPKSRFLPILKALVDHRVDFILVGGVAAVICGAPINTFDLDIVHSTHLENVGRLLAVLRELDAYYRFQPERRFRPNESHLSTRGHSLLMTLYGPLDCLGMIGKGRIYADLLPHSPEVSLTPELSIPVLDLETQIAVKEEVAGEKDLAVLPTLRRTLEESRKQA